MIKVNMQIPLANNKSWRRGLATRTVVIPGIPRVGDGVLITPGGWEEDVRSVWWDLHEGEVNVKLGGKHSQSGCVEYDPDPDDDDEDLITLLVAAGWVVA